MFPIRLLVGAIAVFVVIALTPLFLKVFGERPIQTASLNPPVARPAQTLPLAAGPLSADSQQQGATASVSADVQPTPETERLSPDVTASVPQAPEPEALPESRTAEPSQAIKLPVEPHAASSRAKLRRARRPAAPQKIASRQVQNSFQFSPPQGKPANTEYAPVPLPPPNFSNSGY